MIISFHTNPDGTSALFCKYRWMPVILTLFLLFFAGGVKAQGCTGITYSFLQYEPCKYRAQYDNSTDCFIEIRYILQDGQFATWNVNAAAGYTVEVISPSELWIRHVNGFLPLGNQVPLLFTLPYGLNTTMGVAYLDDCAQLGCEIFGGFPIESCPDPQDARIIGVKYRECGSLPYGNQTPLGGWTIQAIDALGNIKEGVTEADGTYAIYDLPKGEYLVKEVQQPGWTSTVPASGEVVVNLAPSQQRIVNFGNCPPQPPPCDCPAGTLPGGNAVVNGNFSGSGGFTTGYSLNNNNPPLQPGEYWIGSNPASINAGFATCGDHTSGSGNMMVVNGAPSQNTTIWSQTFTMAPNTTYKFEAWLASLSSASPAQLSVFFNFGNVLYEPQRVFASGTTCNWERICVAWPNGPNATTVTVSLVNQNAATTGNDFAIDDISFRRCVPPHGDLSGVVYRECEEMPYTDQAVLSGWTVQLIDTMGNLISEQVTDSSGAYSFTDLPPGNYWVRIVTQSEWSPSIPAAGYTPVTLAPGQVLTQHFGVCRIPVKLCTCPAPNSEGGNLVMNPDFSSLGGFGSEYTPSNGNPPLENGQYWVGSNPNLINNNFQACDDHTPGTGNMLIVNGKPPSGSATLVIWSQTLSVVPHTNYVFSIWVSTLSTGFSTLIGLNADGQSVGGNLPLSMPCIWQKYCGVWNSGSKTTVTLELTSFWFYGPIAIDDIRFSPCTSSIGNISGVVHRSCDSLPYSDQPKLSDWTVQLLDTMGNLISEQVTDSSGAYSFDWPPGQYVVKTVAQQGWTTNVPANGQTTVELDPGESVVANFGVCPGCACDSIYVDIAQLQGSSDTATYFLNIANTGPYCFGSINIQVDTGQLLDWEILLPDWTATPMGPNLIKLTYLEPYLPDGGAIPLRFRIYGIGNHEIKTSTSVGNGSPCERAFDFVSPPEPLSDNCCPAGTTQGPELVVNGDFSIGSPPEVGYISAHDFYPSGSPDPGAGYYTLTNAAGVSAANGGYWSCIGKSGDPNDNFMLVDALTVKNSIVWRTDISNIKPNTNYAFCLYARNVARPQVLPDPEPNIQLWANFNVNLVATANLPRLGPWKKVGGTWFSGPNPPSTIIIMVLETSPVAYIFGRDFALDCISFRECIPPPCSVSISASPSPFCGTGTLTANATGQGPFTYQWSHGQSTQTINVQSLPCGSVCSVSVTCADNTMSSASYTVTDNVPPVPVCNPGVGVDLDVNCMYNVSPSFVDGGSTDNCQIQSMSVSPTIITGCGTTTVTFTVTDWCNNTSTCTMGIQTLEVMPPFMTCPPNTTINGILGPNGLCTAPFSPTPPVAIDNCDPSVTVTNNAPPILQQGANTILWTATDDCGNQTTCIQIVTVECACQCGMFSNLFARPTMGAQSIALSCGGTYNFGCPNPGQSIPITGKFECQGTNCPATSQINWTLIQPDGMATNGTVPAGPYFFLPIMPLQYAQVGTYTLILKGNCGGTDCPPCIIKFTVNCPNPCPCDVNQFQHDVNQGFATALWNNSCKACFSPIALNDCDMVEWKINSGPVIAMTNGGQSFCHTFPSAGTYTVTMIVTRKKSDGSLCEVFTFSKSVTVTCLIDPCDASVYKNPSFSEGAVAGGLNSGGVSTGWKGIWGDPYISDEEIGSQDGWATVLGGNLDTADVLISEDAMCLEKMTGTVTLRSGISTSRSNISRGGGNDRRVELFFNRGDSFVFNTFNSENCYRIAVLDVTAYEGDTSWFNLEVPYDLSDWLALDSCSDMPHGVFVKPIVYTRNCFSLNQGADTVKFWLAIDNLCFDNALVSVNNPTHLRPLRISPNPNPGTFSVELPEPAKPGMLFRITDLTGRLVQEQKTEPGNVKQTVRAEELPNGLYFLQVVSEGKVQAVEKFVKQ